MKTQPIQVRVSLSEKTAFNEAANISGISLSSWIRIHLRRAATRDLEEMGKQVAFLQDRSNANE